MNAFSLFWHKERISIHVPDSANITNAQPPFWFINHNIADLMAERIYILYKDMSESLVSQ